MRKKTKRGFKIYTEFNDTYDTKVWLQESSSVLKRCWIFCENDGQGKTNVMTDGSIHLNVKQAKMIIKALEKFIKDN